MSPVVKLTREELEERRRRLLDHLGVSLEELEARARAYSLTPEERVTWEELGEIGFLLGER